MYDWHFQLRITMKKCAKVLTAQLGYNDYSFNEFKATKKCVELFGCKWLVYYIKLKSLKVIT